MIRRGLLAVMIACVGFGSAAFAQNDGQFWAYCNDPPGYYPYVPLCKVPWRKIPVTPATPPVSLQPPGETQTERQPEPPQVLPQSNPGGVLRSLPSGDEPAGKPNFQPKIAIQPGSSPHPAPIAPPSVPTKSAASPQSVLTPHGPASILLPALFLVASLFPLYRALKAVPGQDPNEAVTIALRRRATWKFYALTVVIISVILAILLPGGAFFIWAGVASAVLVSVLFGRGRLDESNFKPASDFLEGAQQLAALKTVSHVGHHDRFRLFCTRRYRGITSSQPFLIISSKSRHLLITPVRHWVGIGKVYSTGENKSISPSPIRYTERTSFPKKGDTIYGETWEHATKSGDRDLRFRNNQRLFEVLRHGIEIHLRDELRWQLGGMQESDCEAALAAFNIVLSSSNRANGRSRASNDGTSNQRNESRQGAGNSTQSPEPQPWYEILQVNPNATKAEVTAARNKLAKQYHPDRIRGVEGLAPDFERMANQKLVEINKAYGEAMAAIGKGM